MTPRAATSFLLALMATGTVSCAVDDSAIARGRGLASDPGYSTSRSNDFACTTCHAVSPGGDEAIRPGAPLAGATERVSYWGGATDTLRDAVAICFERFMSGGAFAGDDDAGTALYAYLDSLSVSPNAVSTPVPFTVPRAVVPVDPGDATRGAALYRQACARCHGDAHSGAGRLGTRSVVLPEATEQEHTRAMGYTAATLRLVFVEKVRHGSFLGYAGVMPPFSLEVLSDAQLGDIIAYLDPQLH